jgi:drug/metabolite transporter (DMT)-like permease
VARLLRETNAARLAVLAGATFYGGITVGGRWLSDRGFSLYEISLTTVGLTALVLLPLLVARPSLRPQRRDLKLFAAFGAVGAALQLTQFSGIVLGVPVALVALLLYTQPIWTVILGRVWLAEPVTRAKLGAVLLATVGVAVLLDPNGAAGDAPVAGLVAAVLAGVALSIWVILARVSALRGNAAATTTFGYGAGSALWLLAVWPAAALLLPDPAMVRVSAAPFVEHWHWVALYTAAASLLPAMLTMWGMRRVEASTAGVLLLLEPVSAALLAWPLFGEPLGGNLALGAGLILAANWVLLRRRRTGHEPGT